MPYEDRRCLLGGVEVRDGIATVGEMGYDSAQVGDASTSLTHPITAHARATKLRRMGPLPVCLGLPCGSWTRPACARGGSGGGRPLSSFSQSQSNQMGDPRQLRWPGSPGLLFGLGLLAGCPSPSSPSAPPSALHPRGEAAGGAKWETDRPTWPGSGWIHRDPAPGF